MKKFGGDVAETADTVKGAADEIDESLATTASGVDPLELAAARVSAAEDQMTASTEALAAAQQRLVAVSGNVATQEEMGAAAEDVAAAEQRAAAATTEMTAAAAAQREALTALIAGSAEAAAATDLYVDADGRLRDSAGRFATAAEVQQASQDAVNASQDAGTASADALAGANERVAAAQKATADATAEASAAQARQDALAGSGDVAAAASSLSKAEKDAAASSKSLSAAQQQQAAVQKAVAMSSDEAKAAALAQAGADKEAAENSEALSGAVGGIGKIAGITAIGMGVLGAVAVKAAGNFQSMTAHLVTDAGESAKNLSMIRAGILSISSATGTSATDITNAMYHIESAGIHGAAGLAVAKVAAEGAKVGGADLDTVSKTLVGTLNSYGMTSKNSAVQTQYATQMMNMLVATVGSGDMRMQDLASSLGSVTPLASAAGLSFAQVGGAVATMTSQNMTAQRATQDLDNLLRNIVKPAKTASTEMRYLGLNANQVSTSLKGQGLTGVMNEFTTAILKNSQGGMVSLGYYKQMTPATQALAQGILAGKVSTEDLTTAMKGMTPQQAQVITQFKAAAVSATGLKQTYTGALATLTGGATGLNTSLMLTGKNAGAFAGNVAKIAAEGKKAGTSVDNWSTIQGTFNQKVDVAKTAVENTGIAVGSALLPAVTKLFSMISKVVVPIAEWTAKHQKLTEILFVGVTALAATVAVLVVVGKTFKAVSSGIDEVRKAYNGAVSVLQKLAGKSKQTAGQQQSDAAKTATANEQASEQSATAAETAAGQEEVASGEAAAAAETDAGEMAAANETAAAESSGNWVTAAATTVGGWAKAGGQMILSAAKWVAQGAIKVAAYVATNVAGALATAGAWMVANAAMLLGIGLIVIAVIAAVLLIIKYWKDIEKAAVAVWDAVVDAAKAAWNWVVSFVRAVWDSVTSDIRKAHAVIMAVVQAAWKFVESLIDKEISNVKKILGWFGKLGSLFRGWWHDATSAVTSEVGKMITFAESIPGRILHALGDVGHLLWNAGASVIHGLVNGIKSAIGDVESTVSGVASTIKSFLPFSPAKQGPLSGSGDPSNSGKSIAAKLATGMLAARGAVSSAAGQLAASASPSGHVGTTGSASALSAIGPAGGAVSSGIVVNLTINEPHMMTEADMGAFMNRMGPALNRALGQAGVKIRMG
jgi:phage-related protein